MIPAAEPQTLCLACRLNNVIPNLEHAESHALWAEVERAKRRLIYTLSRLGLPLRAKCEDPQSGLAFDIKPRTVALNALNRSMGLADAYPFAISSPVREKLEFVHRAVAAFRVHGADQGKASDATGALPTSSAAAS